MGTTVCHVDSLISSSSVCLEPSISPSPPPPADNSLQLRDSGGIVAVTGTPPPPYSDDTFYNTVGR